MANNYAINYEDERFTKVENAKETALSDLEKTYTDMIDKSDKYYQDQVTATEQWADKQTQLQNEQTDFAIQKIEQQKEQAKKDYTKEQSGAYVDWRKQSNEYGSEAEKMAASGLHNTGFAESSQVSMYNAYQNRVAVARETYNKILMDFNNGIREAQLQNNSALAEIQFRALEKKLQLNLEGFQYKNQLLREKTEQKTNLDQIYYARYQDVLAQINHENALAEQIRQYNASLAEEQRQYNATLEFQKQQYADQKAAEAARLQASIAKPKVTKSPGNSPPKKTNPKKNSSTSKGTVRSGSFSNGSSSESSGSNNKKTMESISALGYGPISEAKLASLVNSGVVQEYTVDGVTLFKKSPFALKQSQLVR